MATERTEEIRNAYRILVGKLAGNVALGRPKQKNGKIMSRWVLNKCGVM